MTVWLFSASAAASSAAALIIAATDLTSFLNLPGQILRLAGALLGRLGQRPHLVGDDREAAAVIAGARRLDGGIEREQIGLVRNLADGFRHLADAGGLLAQLFDDGDRARLALAVVLDVARPRPDLVRRSPPVGPATSPCADARTRPGRGPGRASRAVVVATARVSCEALAASSAPLAICSMARRNSSAADAASVIPLASSSVAAAMRSSIFCWRRAELAAEGFRCRPLVSPPWAADAARERPMLPREVGSCLHERFRRPGSQMRGRIAYRRSFRDWVRQRSIRARRGGRFPVARRRILWFLAHRQST